MANIYLAGPMSGLPYFNRAAFDDQASLLRMDGHAVWSPVEQIPRGVMNERGEESLSVRRQMCSEGLRWLCYHADRIHMLPAWESSLGARAEHAIAVSLGLEVTYCA